MERGSIKIYRETSDRDRGGAVSHLMEQKNNITIAGGCQYLAWWNKKKKGNWAQRNL